MSAVDQTHFKIKTRKEKHGEPAPEIERETRLAVVMYGGISLAIYIHGVAQELYHLVLATSRVTIRNREYYYLPLEYLTGTEKIYRHLGEALKTKFVVDILSGTSAGGLNAVFLAKALVNNRSMEFVKRFWVDEGDISVLLNDGESLNGLSGLPLQKPTLGLLNSRRFYYKLLEALMKMGSSAENYLSPHVQNLDLNITATDIRGLNLPLTISNKVLNERRFKNVFQFYYRPSISDEEPEPRNDFTLKMDPFLAFAARCTASIPPAFEAMQLQDIEPILKTETFMPNYGNLSMNEPDWRRFYKDYLSKGDDFPLRSFGDGGYLDNKPFSHATDALLRRRADLPVDRRLIYIEPSPEHPENKPHSTEKPDMVQNVLAALLSLPREETIREDLKVIDERNKIINRVNHILRDAFSWGAIYPDVKGKEKKKYEAWLYDLDWAKTYPMDQDVRRWYGSGYFAYHQLRVESVLSNLSQTFARALGWSEEGEEERNIHQVLHAWLDRDYSKSDEEDKYSQNDILFRLDLGFRMRKHTFLQYILNIFLRDLDDLTEHKKTDKTDMENIFAASGNPLMETGEGDIKWIRQYLLDLKREVNTINDHAQAQGRALRSWGVAKRPSADKEMAGYVKNLLQIEKLLSKGSGTSDDRLLDAIEKLTVAMGTHPFVYDKKKKDWIQNKEPAGYLKETFGELRNYGRTIGIVNIRDKDGQNPALNLIDELYFAKKKNLDPIKGVQLKRVLKFCNQIQKCLAYYYDNFEYYDMLTFPIQYGTEAGESDFVEVLRVSPEDATRLLDEKETGKKKLAGTQLSNFGAFFKKEWRQNDMLWGRLDAAEILIEQLLKGPVVGVDAGNKGAEKKRTDRLGKIKAEFTTAIRKLYQSEFGKEPSRDKEASESIPYDLASQFILEEDLLPLDKAVLHNFLSADKDTAEETFYSVNADETEKPTSDELEKVRDRKDKLKQMEDQLLKTLSRNYPNDNHELLRKGLIEAVDRERSDLETEERRLRSRLTHAAEEKRKLAELEGGIIAETVEGMDKLESPEVGKEIVSAVERVEKKNPIRYKQIMRAMGDHAILDSFKLGYQTNPNFEVKPTISVANRSAKVLSGLIDGLAEKYPISKPAGVLRTAAQVFAGLVNVVMPKTLGNFLFEGYWVWLVYLASIILYYGGRFLDDKDASNLAIATIIVTALLHLFLISTRNWLEGKTLPIKLFLVLLRLLGVLLILLLSVAAYSGLVHLNIIDEWSVLSPLVAWVQRIMAP